MSGSAGMSVPQSARDVLRGLSFLALSARRPAGCTLPGTVLPPRRSPRPRRVDWALAPGDPVAPRPASPRACGTAPPGGSGRRSGVARRRPVRWDETSRGGDDRHDDHGKLPDHLELLRSDRHPRRLRPRAAPRERYASWLRRRDVQPGNSLTENRPCGQPALIRFTTGSHRGTKAWSGGTEVGPPSGAGVGRGDRDSRMRGPVADQTGNHGGRLGGRRRVLEPD